MPTTRSQLSAHVSTHENDLEDTEEIQQTLPVQHSDPPLDDNPARSNRSPSALDYVIPDQDRPLSPAPHQQFQPSPTPARQQGFSQPPEEPSLAQAIMYMTETLRPRDLVSAKRAKSKEPDTFDGSDPKKLNNFLLLCNLYFRQNPSYTEDATKITFALSYLRGMALEYFEPTLLDSDDFPDWMDNWDAFVRTLRTQFGPIDPAGDAENGIDYLKMQDNQRIIKYNVEFHRLAIRTGWDEAVLRHRYYTGLAERIKDIMGQQGKPATLDAMKTLAHAIDARHWERLREKSRSGKSKSDDKTDDHKSDKGKKSDDKGKNPSSGNSNSNSNNNNNKNKNNKDNKPNKASSSSASSNPLADKLGKDGKLTQQERQRRFDNNLCMFCGGVGHTAANCNKAAASKAKARAAQAKEKDPPAGDSKKV